MLFPVQLPSTEAGLRLSELLAQICSFLKKFGLLQRFVIFGAAQMGDGRGIQCPGCQARRNSPRSEGVLGNAAAALEDTSEALMGWG